MKRKLDDSMKIFGFSSEMKINDVFKNMIGLIEEAKSQLQDE